MGWAKIIQMEKKKHQSATSRTDKRLSRWPPGAGRAIVPPPFVTIMKKRKHPMDQDAKNSTRPKRSRSHRKRIVLLCTLLLLLIGGVWFLRSGRPWLNGVKAYIYGFPLVVMDLTREIMTAVPTAGEINAPVNQFAVMSHFPDTSFRAIPRTGLDSLFATAWADLGAEPLVLSVPNTGGRYYVIALFDYWSNVFASIGPRTTGTGAADFLIAGPGWQGTASPGIAEVFRSPTRWVWVNGQMRSDGPQEAELVTSLQKRYRLTPLSAWGRPHTPIAVTVPSEKSASNGAPLDQIRTMDAQAFFGRLALLMKGNPPTPADDPMVEKLKGLGIVPGKPFDIARITPASAKALQRAMWAFALLEKGVQKLKTDNGWIVIPDNFANYGTDYLTRAGIALIGLGGIWPIDILYPVAFLDGDDKPLDSANRYVLHFEKGQTPPTQEVWSVSMYDPKGFFVPNPIDRYNLADWMPLKYNADGSLDIYIQAESPGPDKDSNWLPAPPSGPFNLVTRIFWPGKAALDGTWRMPPVKRMP